MIQKLLLTGSFFCPITESHKGTHTKATLIAVLQKKVSRKLQDASL